MPEPLEPSTFWTVVTGLAGAGAAALGWLAKSNSSSVTELWKARNETHEAVTQVRVLVAGQPTRAEFQAMEQRVLSAISNRKSQEAGD